MDSHARLIAWMVVPLWLLGAAPQSFAQAKAPASKDSPNRPSPRRQSPPQKTTETPRDSGGIVPEQVRAIEFVERKMLHIKWEFWRGIRIHRRGKKLAHGFLGKNYRKLFFGSERATKQAGRGHNFQLAGFTMSMFGIGTMLLEAALIPVFLNFSGQVLSIAYTIALTTSLLLSLVGSLILAVGQMLFYNAVAVYNKDLLQYAKTQSWTSSLQPDATDPSGAPAQAAPHARLATILRF